MVVFLCGFVLTKPHKAYKKMHFLKKSSKKFVKLRIGVWMFNIQKPQGALLSPCFIFVKFFCEFVCIISDIFLNIFTTMYYRTINRYGVGVGNGAW